MATRTVFRGLALLAVGLLLFLVWIPAADAVRIDFEYKVDRFEVTGNLPGSIVDEFDDDTLAPWTTTFGTAEEAGGYAILKSPGTLLPFPGYPNLVLDRSDILAPEMYNVLDGAGDFTATSTWSPVIPDLPGGFYAMYLEYQLNDSVREAIAIGVGNYAPSVVLSEEAIGLQFLQTKYTWVADIGFLQQWESYIFDPADLTGDIVLRLEFDDATNQVTQSFSMNGGVTFNYFSHPIQSYFSGAYPGVWKLLGDPTVVIPEPSTALLLAVGLAGLATTGRRRRS